MVKVVFTGLTTQPGQYQVDGKKGNLKPKLTALETSSIEQNRIANIREFLFMFSKKDKQGQTIICGERSRESKQACQMINTTVKLRDPGKKSQLWQQAFQMEHGRDRALHWNP